MRWVTGLVVAAGLALAGVASLLVGVAVAVARDGAGAGLTGQAHATVLATDFTDGATNVLVWFDPGDGATTSADVEWTATDPPRPGDQVTVAYDPDDPARARPAADVDPTGGWAAEWQPAPWYVGGGVGLFLALATVVAAARWAARRPRR